MVAHLEVERRPVADLADRAPRRPRPRRARRDAARLGRVAASSSRRSSTSASSPSSGLISSAQLAHLGDPRLGVLARALRGGDLVRDGVAASPSLLDPRQQLAPASVQREQLVERVGRPAARQRGARLLGLRADALQVEHRAPGGCLAAYSSGRCGPVDLAARVVRDEVGNGLGVLSDHDVLRHQRPREAAVADREQDIVDRLLTLVQVRALVAQRPVGRPARAGRVHRVTAGAALGEQDGALVVRVVLGELDALAAAGAEQGRRRKRGCDGQDRTHRGGIILSDSP